MQNTYWEINFRKRSLFATSELLYLQRGLLTKWSPAAWLHGSSWVFRGCFSCVCAAILKITYVGERDGCLRLGMFQKCHWHTDLPKWGPWRLPWGHNTLREQHMPNITRHHKTEVALPLSPAAGWSRSLWQKVRKRLVWKAMHFALWFSHFDKNKDEMKSFAELGEFGVREWNVVFLEPPYV